MNDSVNAANLPMFTVSLNVEYVNCGTIVTRARYIFDRPKDQEEQIHYSFPTGTSLAESFVVDLSPGS